MNPKSVVDQFLGRSKRAANIEVNEERIEVLLKSEFGDTIDIQTKGDYDMDHKVVTLSCEVTFVDEQHNPDEMVAQAQQVAVQMFGEGAEITINRPSFQFFTIKKNFMG